MLDAAELAARLSSSTDWAGAVEVCERHMFTRVREAAADSAEAAAVQLSHDDLALTLAHFRAHSMA